MIQWWLFAAAVPGRLVVPGPAGGPRPGRTAAERQPEEAHRPPCDRRTGHGPAARPRDFLGAPGRTEETLHPRRTTLDWPLARRKPHPVNARIEDYALIGDKQTAALVGKDGSIDRLCLPRFDSGSCFARLLGDEDHGHWRIAPKGADVCTRRAYRSDTLVLDHRSGRPPTARCASPTWMPQRERAPTSYGSWRGSAAGSPVRSTLRLRFDHYGSDHALGAARTATGWPSPGRTPPGCAPSRTCPPGARDYGTHAEFTLTEGERVAFVLTWHPLAREAPAAHRPVLRHWRAASPTGGAGPAGAGTTARTGTRSSAPLITLQGPHLRPDRRDRRRGHHLAARAAGAACATGTTGTAGCATPPLTLGALLSMGFQEEAEAWRDWLLRAVAGDPADPQIACTASRVSGGCRRPSCPGCPASPAPAPYAPATAPSTSSSWTCTAR